jgi:hypothetical protein
MGRRTSMEPQTPEPWLWGGLAFAGAAWIVTTFVAPNYDPLKFLGAQSSASAGLAALFLGAIISVRIYDYVNRRAERRQLRHDYALSRLRDIYIPLWDETAALMELAKRYDAAELWYGTPERHELLRHGFVAIMKGSLRLFVDAGIKALLSSFHAAVAKYNKAVSTARNDFYAKAQVFAHELTGRPEGDAVPTAVANLFTTNNRLVWGATDFGEEAEQAMRVQFREMYSRGRTTAPKETDAAFNNLRDRLRSLDTSEAMRRESRTCVDSGERVIRRLEEIVMDPTSVVLEFED